MSRGAQRIGFAVSAVVHVAITGMFVLPGSGPVESAAPRPTMLDLAMFAPVVHEAPRLDEATSMSQPQPVPEPPSADPPEPDTPPPVAEPVEPPPLRDPDPEPEPEPEPEPKPAPPPEPQRVETPPARSRPVVREPPPRPATSELTRAKPSPPPAVAADSPPPAAEKVAVGPPSRQSLPARDVEKIRRAYLAELARAIDARKHYPRRSRRRGEEGTVVVAFVILADGSIVDVALERPSGYRRLDGAALESVSKLGSVRPIPAGLARDRWPITVPIEFRLR